MRFSHKTPPKRLWNCLDGGTSTFHCWVTAHAPPLQEVMSNKRVRQMLKVLKATLPSTNAFLFGGISAFPLNRPLDWFPYMIAASSTQLQVTMQKTSQPPHVDSKPAAKQLDALSQIDAHSVLRFFRRCSAVPIHPGQLMWV